MRNAHVTLACSVAAALSTTSARADEPAVRTEPSIEVAPEHRAAPEAEPVIALGAGSAPEHELVRGLTEQRFRSASASTVNTSIGGYGELLVKGTTSGKEGEREWLADIPRLVLFVAHSFNDDFRAYLELEVEHAMACKSCPGAVELEQAYLDWKRLDAIGIRAGLVLVPMGIINQWHEPPIYHGAVRPKVETVVIPSTWRELGVGVFGQPVDMLRYELYAVTGLAPDGISAGGIGGGRQNGALARASGWAATGRVEIEPWLGAVFGVAGYAGDAGPNGSFAFADGRKADLAIPVLGWAADARWRKWGLEWKMLFAEWRLPESGALMAARGADGAPVVADRTRPAPTVIRGGYVEGAYDVLRPFELGHQLLPFARIEHYDTQAEVPEGFVPHPSYSVREYTFGLSYRPIQEIVVKLDYQLRNRKLGFDETQLNVGVGFMY